MRMKKLLGILPLLLCAVMAHAEVQLVILTTSGTETPLPLSNLRKMTFSKSGMWGETVFFHDMEGNYQFKALENIEKLYFKDDGSDAVDDISAPALHFYPNPAAESIIVSGLQKGETLHIYSLEGQLLQTTTASDSEAIVPVSGLNNGTYLLQAGKQVVKFIKK